jgi:hypothetical protein
LAYLLRLDNDWFRGAKQPGHAILEKPDAGQASKRLVSAASQDCAGALAIGYRLK